VINESKNGVGVGGQQQQQQRLMFHRQISFPSNNLLHTCAFPPPTSHVSTGSHDEVLLIVGSSYDVIAVNVLAGTVIQKISLSKERKSTLSKRTDSDNNSAGSGDSNICTAIAFSDDGSTIFVACGGNSKQSQVIIYGIDVNVGGSTSASKSEMLLTKPLGQKKRLTAKSSNDERNAVKRIFFKRFDSELFCSTLVCLTVRGDVQIYRILYTKLKLSAKKSMRIIAPAAALRSSTFLDNSSKNQLCCSPSARDNSIVCGSEEGSICAYGGKSRKEICRISGIHSGGINALDWCDDESRVLTGDASGDVILWKCSL
jgi:WD40 repeat protein